MKGEPKNGATPKLLGGNCAAVASRVSRSWSATSVTSMVTLSVTV